MRIKSAMAACKGSLLVALGLLAGGLLGGPVGAAETPSPETPPPAYYWHLWTDGQGATHQTRCRLEHFTVKSVNPPDTPEWVNMFGAKPSKIAFVIQPVGWTAPWHLNPQTQFIVPISGHWSVTSTDGHKVVMGPGDISFGEDQLATHQPDGHWGHLSASEGHDPVVLMFVQMQDPPKQNDVCPFH